MVNGVEIKVCGLTRLSDALAAESLGVDYLGFNFFPESPRYLSIPDYRSISEKLPDLPTVAIAVLPDRETIVSLQELGINFYQFHYPAEETPQSTIQEWSSILGPEKLWLAPRITPPDIFQEDCLPLADTWLLDAYRKGAYGGTGQTSDWAEFARISEKHPEKTWILAGGLGPDNVKAALAETGAKRIDLNSGVEILPGIKDPSKLESVKNALETL
ncbi:MAG: phosphoribosylanthranilate isomerase [Opitutaceae bacterium]|nr:phosphoribosylanthranilate isomerase [Opitutaceae bacterium]|tara:strand:- start:1045 stop:1692 length:648 start_codon:yes stop_codon:yes gene_type:complete